MKLSKLTPVLYTNKLQETIDFYVNTFGFTCLAFDVHLVWAKIRLNEIDLMLSKPVAHLSFKEAIFTGSFYFLTDNVEEIWIKIKDKTKICYPIEDFNYGMREFAVYDNNGYLLQFGQEIEIN